MNAFKKTKSDYPKFLTVNDASARYQIGKNTVRNIAEKIGAAVHIGRLIRIDIAVMDSYFDSLTK